MLGGAPAEMVEALAAESADLEVEPENWDVVMLFLRVQTQWRYSFGGPTGLDYTGVEAAMRLAGIQQSADLFDGLQVMEVAALREMNATRD